ncbi:MAG: ComF family protein [Deltaproteobacteria bacterium]|uniref:ComF family protein n=1 Tax=Desulfobacula sp. TaxID=2593537 RepID=UPI0019939466|nr:ComF family protein [Candidatus Desulfobacula maris]MBL6993257.1 ComF family protein [Desulfobacula sp.]
MFKIFQNHCKPYYVSALKKTIRLFEQLLYPLKCLKCGVYIDPDMVEPHTMDACFCDHCMALGFYPMDSPFCTKCGVKFHKSFNENHMCESCLKTPLKLDRVRAALEYKGIIKDAIPLFKYHSKLSIAKVFERLLFETFLCHYANTRIDLIMPVPLHKKKLRERGFNQAFLLIRNFVKLYQQTFEQSPLWKIDTISLARIKMTQPQTGFDIDQRKANLKNAFKVINHKAIDNKHILLIDDVFTTGATCNEAARVLLKYGANKVDALVLART